MVFVEHLLGAPQIMPDLAPLGPGNADYPIQIATHNRRLRRHWRHHLELAQFSIGFFERFFGHLRVIDFILQIVDFVGGVVHFTQFSLYRFHLLIQVVLSLALFHLLFDSAANPFLDLKQVNFRIH